MRSLTAKSLLASAQKEVAEFFQDNYEQDWMNSIALPWMEKEGRGSFACMWSSSWKLVSLTGSACCFLRCYHFFQSSFLRFLSLSLVVRFCNSALHYAWLSRVLVYLFVIVSDSEQKKWKRTLRNSFFCILLLTSILQPRPAHTYQSSRSISTIRLCPIALSPSSRSLPTSRTFPLSPFWTLSFCRYEQLLNTEVYNMW